MSIPRPNPPAVAPPYIEIRDLEQARLTLEIAAGRSCTLLSIRGGSRLMGSPWWQALIDALGTPVAHVLDCDDAAGRAAGALRAGQPAIVFEAASPQFSAILALAETCHAVVLAQRPPSFTLGLPPYTAYRRAQLDLYLNQEPPHS